MFDILSRFDWLLFIVFGSGVIVWVRRQVGLSPAVALRPLLIANSIWLLQGVGTLLYPGRDSFDFYDLRLGVLPFLLIASMVLIWISLLDWIFRRSGAELLAESSESLGLLNLPRSADGIKMLAVVCMGGGALGLSMMVLLATESPR